MTPKNFNLYRLQPAPAVVALRLILSNDGRVTTTPGDDWVDAALAMLGRGVLSIRPLKVTVPEDGSAYIEAVLGMLSNSSLWALVAVEEPAGHTGWPNQTAGRKAPRAAPKKGRGVGSSPRRSSGTRHIPKGGKG